MGVTPIVQILVVSSAQMPRTVLRFVIGGKGEEERLFWGE